MAMVNVLATKASVEAALSKDQLKRLKWKMYLRDWQAPCRVVRRVRRLLDDPFLRLEEEPYIDYTKRYIDYLKEAADAEFVNSLMSNCTPCKRSNGEVEWQIVPDTHFDAFVQDYLVWCFRVYSKDESRLLEQAVQEWAGANGIGSEVASIEEWLHWLLEAAAEGASGIMRGPNVPFSKQITAHSPNIKVFGEEMWEHMFQWEEQAFIFFVDKVSEQVEDFVRMQADRPNYLRLYGLSDFAVAEPQDNADLLAALNSFLELWCDKHHINKAERMRFYSALKQQSQSGVKPPDMTEVQYSSARFWTSQEKLMGPSPHDGKELCSILAQVDRDDATDLLAAGALKVQKGINTLLVTRRKGVVQWTGKTYRGTGMPPSALTFFEQHVGKNYRAPMPLATSTQKGVASGFLARMNPHCGNDCVRFEFVFRTNPPHHEASPCVHVNYLENITEVKGEEEFLFVAYSVFEVKSVTISKNPTYGFPHEVVLNVMPDNRTWSENLPLATWH